jgi:hypothetical protein
LSRENKKWGGKGKGKEEKEAQIRDNEENNVGDGVRDI